MQLSHKNSVAYTIETPCIISAPKQGGYVFASVCLSAKLLKMLLTDFGEIYGRMGRGTANSRLEIGGDPVHDPYPGICLMDRLLYWYARLQL